MDFVVMQTLSSNYLYGFSDFPTSSLSLLVLHTPLNFFLAFSFCVCAFVCLVHLCVWYM